MVPGSRKNHLSHLMPRACMRLSMRILFLINKRSISFQIFHKLIAHKNRQQHIPQRTLKQNVLRQLSPGHQALACPVPRNNFIHQTHRHKKPLRQALNPHVVSLISGVIKLNLSYNAVQSEHDCPKTEAHKRLESALRNTVVRPVTVMVHHQHTPAAFTTVVGAPLISHCRTFFAHHISLLGRSDLDVARVRIACYYVGPQHHDVQEDDVAQTRVKIVFKHSI